MAARKKQDPLTHPPWRLRLRNFAQLHTPDELMLWVAVLTVAVLVFYYFLW